MDPALLFDFLAVLDLLDHVRSGYFDMVHIVPSAATWSRSRHSEHSGQSSPPLKIFSFGSVFTFARRDPEDQQGQSSSGTSGLGCGAGAPMPIKIHWSQYHVFPEDLGGHCVHGPSSIWVLREFRFLEGVRDARRAAAYICQFTRSEYKRPIGILSNCTSLRPLLFLGWPNLVEVQNTLKYKGPLPLSCACGREHTTSLIGLTDDSTFLTSCFYWVSVPVSGLPVSTMIFWKGVSFPLGMAIDLISLHWTILHSSHRRWLPLRFRYGPRMSRGKLVRLRRRLCWILLLQILLRPISLLRFQLFFGLVLSFVSVRSLWKVSPVSSTAVLFGRLICLRFFLDSSGHFIARAITLTLSYEKTPGPSATEGRCFIRGDWRSILVR